MTSRNLVSLAVLTVLGVLLVGQVRQLLADPTVWPPDDFVEYWAAAKLTLNGQNPFAAELLLPLQQHAGRDTNEAIMMWNPPWSLPAVLPLGLFDARTAQLLWLVLHFIVTAFCADRLWLLLGGARNRRWLALALVYAFMPTQFALSSGQISIFLLLGAVLYWECERRNWQYLAGAATVLLAIKPHLAYLVWTAIAVDAVTRGRWRVIVGGAVVGVICAAIPLAFNPQVWHQYADAMANRPPSQWLSPTLGTVLRFAFGEQLFRLQFVSVMLGLGWFAWYRWQKSREWNAIEQLPLLLAVSFVSAPYGAWPFDMVLLLPAVFVIAVAAIGGRTAACGCRTRTLAVFAGIIAVNIGCLVLNLRQTGSFYFLWVSPVILLLYIIHTRKQLSPVHAQSPTPVTA
jgi:hypothetical protein